MGQIQKLHSELTRLFKVHEGRGESEVLTWSTESFNSRTAIPNRDHCFGPIKLKDALANLKLGRTVPVNDKDSVLPEGADNLSVTASTCQYFSTAY